MAFGRYVGEILTRHAGGSWRRTMIAPTTAAPLVVELPDARECRPIDRVFRRPEFGTDVSVRTLCAAAGTERGHPVERARR
ncbi:hypothetical protein [Streptomyces sp. NPDC056796]|uniref:hypothetical protein n=1 Tax=unclassified Streptomyces TaxID=2593676 RepID=UPI003696C7E5